MQLYWWYDVSTGETLGAGTWGKCDTEEVLFKSEGEYMEWVELFERQTRSSYSMNMKRVLNDRTVVSSYVCSWGRDVSDTSRKKYGKRFLTDDSSKFRHTATPNVNLNLNPVIGHRIYRSKPRLSRGTCNCMAGYTLWRAPNSVFKVNY